MNIKDFVDGTAIINNYVNRSSMCAIGETSTFIYAYLNKINPEDKEKLESLGWKVLSGGSYCSVECKIYVAAE